MQKLLLWGGIGFGAIVIIIFIVALSTRDSSKTTKTGGKNDKKVVTFWSPIDEPEIFKDIIARYQQANPNVKIKYVYKSPITTYDSESTDALSAGQGPDIWAIHNSFIPKHLAKLAPMPDGFLATSKKNKDTDAEIVTKKYVPIVSQENISEEKVYGLPLFVDTLVLFTNPSLLNAKLRSIQKQGNDVNSSLFSVGPKDWNEFVDLVKIYTERNNDDIVKSAVALGRSDNVRNAQDILAVLMVQNGASIASPDGLTATFHLPSPKATGIVFEAQQRYFPGVEALKFFSAFSDKTEDVFTWDNTFSDSYDAFINGETAMMIDYSSTALNIAQDKPTLNYKILPLPQIRNATDAIDMADYWTLTVPKISKNQPEAWNFIRYLTTVGQSSYLANTRRPSPLKPKSTPRSVKERVEVKNPFRYQTQTAQSWYRGKDPADVEVEFLSMINQVVNQNIAPDQAASAAAKKISEIFRLREGYSINPSTTPEKQLP